jgi:hypothetical protein
MITGSVLRLDTKEGLANVRVQFGATDELPTGYDKPCKPQTNPEPTGTVVAMTNARGQYAIPNPVQRSAAQQQARTEEEEATRRIIEMERLRQGGVDLLPGQSPLESLLTPDDAVAYALKRTFGTAAVAEREGFVQVMGGEPIYMAPAPTITGRLIDQFDRPVPAASVQAYSVRYTPLGRSLKWVKSTLTNDLGDYRLSWLPYGRYYVVAGNSQYVLQPWLEGLRSTPNLPDPDLGLPLLFYPGVIAAADAQLVTINPTNFGQTHPVINLALRLRPRFDVKVRLVANPMPENVSLVFLPYGGDLCAGMDYAIQPTRDGSFDVRDVPEGLYVMVAIRGKETVSELVPVNVNKNLDDLKLTLVPSTPVAGTIRFTGLTTGTDITSITRDLRVNLTRVRQDVSHVATAVMDPNTHNFSITGVGPGLYYPTVNVPRGSYIKDIRVMKWSRVPGVRPENWVCDSAPAGVYSYVNGNGHLQALEVPRVTNGDNPADPSCLNIEVSFEGKMTGRAIQFICLPPPAPCPTPLGGAVVVLMPRSTWLKQSSADITPPDRIITTVSGDGGPGRWDLRGFPMDGEYKIFTITGFDPEMIYAPAFHELLGGRGYSVLANTNPCPEYRQTVPERDAFLVSRCEVKEPSSELLEETRSRAFR